MRRRIPAAAALCILVFVHAATASTSTIETWNLNPFWAGNVMHGESLLFLEPEGGGPATAPLLFKPQEIRKLIHPATSAVYEAGRDFIVDPAGKQLTLTENSPIPFTTRADYEPPVGKSGQLYKDGSRDIFFGAGPYFHERQVEITYTHAPNAWDAAGGVVPPSAAALLPAIMKKLGAKKPLSICLLGDSISTGLDASSTSNSKPNMPGYGDLVVGALEEHYGSPITFNNFSVSGMATPWGIEQAPSVAEKKPDLVIIAFGMNDASGRMAPETYRANTVAMMDGIRAEHPEASFILVATMLGNTDWKHAAGELYPQYRDALKTLEGPGVAVADVTSVWGTLLAHKRFIDITGNGVNHPNDFGHRIYAQVILALLGVGGTE